MNNNFNLLADYPRDKFRYKLNVKRIEIDCYLENEFNGKIYYTIIVYKRKGKRGEVHKKYYETNEEVFIGDNPYTLFRCKLLDTHNNEIILSSNIKKFTKKDDNVNYYHHRERINYYNKENIYNNFF